MKSHTNAVADFHNKVSSRVADTARLLECDRDNARQAAKELRQTLKVLAALDSSNSELMLRLEFAVEELCEWVEAHADADLVAAADAWGDRCYVLLGDAVATGMPVDDIFWEVHRSNMTKASAPSSHGKGTKSDGFESPDLANILKTASTHQS